MPPLSFLRLAFLVANSPHDEVDEGDEDESGHETDHDADFVRGAWAGVVGAGGRLVLCGHGGDGGYEIGVWWGGRWRVRPFVRWRLRVALLGLTALSFCLVII